jgi:DNA-directed RNA polymerase specialized sigma24 family protein
VDEIPRLLNVPDLVVRAQMASAAMDDHRRAMFRLAGVRGQALLELRRSGHSAAELARMLGVTRQQVHRLLREALGRDDRPEDHDN